MDRAVVEEKIEALRHYVRRLRDKCPQDISRLEQDLDLQDIVAMNLARAVQLCVDIAAHIISESEIPAPSTMAAAFESLQQMGVLDEEAAGAMKKAVGFRNIAVHSYDKIDWAIVQSVCQHRLVDFERFAQAIMRELPDR